MGHYPVEVFWSEDDEAYVAIAPDLPGCSAAGDTEAKAIKELRTAIELWLEAMKKAGNPIPEPSNPAEELSYSGKFLMRVPRRLHANLTRAARAQGVSLNQYILYLLASRHSSDRDAA